MLHYYRRAPAFVAFVEADYRFRVVMEGMPAEELHAAVHIAVDLGCRQHGDVVFPGHPQKSLGLPDEIIPYIAVLMVETVEHGEGIYDNERYGSRGG